MADESPNTLGYDPAPNEPPDATLYASPPEEGYEPHPLFPCDSDGRDPRDIQYVTFRRRRSSDGRIENCPEDIPASEIRSWAEVFALWGGGEYKAIAKNRYHRVIAFSPQGPGDWMQLDTDSKPFTPRNTSRYRPNPPVPGPAAPSAPPPASAVLPPPPPSPASAAFAPGSPLELAVMELLRDSREAREARARPPQPTIDPVLIELLRESRAPRGPSNENAMLEIVKALMIERRAEPSTAVAVEMLRAMREFTPQAPPPAPQPTVADRLSEYRQIRELTGPVAPAPPPSEFGELKDLFTSVMQADLLTKTTREPPAPPPPPPPPPLERRPPPRRPLVHIQGVGLVDIVEPEPPPRIPAPELDLEALLADPGRAQKLKRLLDERLEVPGTAPAAPVPAKAVPSAPGEAEPPRDVASPAAPPSAPEGAPPAAHDREPAAPLPTTGTPEPIVTGPASTPAPEPIVAGSAPTRTAPEPGPVPKAGVPEPTAAVPAPTPTAPAPIPTGSLPTAGVPQPSSTEPSASREREPIGLPARMPASGSRPLTPEECERAVHALRTFSRMPLDQQRAELRRIPGMGNQLDELMTAFGALPSEAWPAVVSKLPHEVIRVLLEGPGR